MSGFSVSGLGSGIDTAALVSQLMQLEAIPRTKLEQQLASEKLRLTSLQSLNSRVSALATQAKALADPASWDKLAATSSHTGVSVTAAGGTASGTIDVQVGQTALAHRMTFADTAALDDVVVSGSTQVELTLGGESTLVETGDGTLAGLVSALNAGGTGVTASTVRLDDGSYRLSVRSIATGTDSAFTLTSADATPLLGSATVVAGRDAAITIDGDTIHSPTNTFNGVLSGVDIAITEAAVGQSAQITVARDTTSVSTQVETFVGSVNSLLSEIDRLTVAGTSTASAGVLRGVAGARDLRTAVLNAVFPPDGTSMAAVGVQTDRTGKLVFDAGAFAEAYAADPAGTAAAFTSGPNAGFAARVQSLADTASDSISGTLTAAITGRNSAIDRLESGIESWNLRLEKREASLKRQYVALETALSRMNSQSQWLTSQIGALTANSPNNS